MVNSPQLLFLYINMAVDCPYTTSNQRCDQSDIALTKCLARVTRNPGVCGSKPDEAVCAMQC